jgi:hypothetical protein
MTQTASASGDPRSPNLEPETEPTVSTPGRRNVPIKPDPEAPGVEDPPVREPNNSDPSTPGPARPPVREPNNPNPSTPRDAPVREPIDPDPSVRPRES